MRRRLAIFAAICTFAVSACSTNKSSSSSRTNPSKAVGSFDPSQNSEAIRTQGGPHGPEIGSSQTYDQNGNLVQYLSAQGHQVELEFTHTNQLKSQTVKTADGSSVLSKFQILRTATGKKLATYTHTGEIKSFGAFGEIKRASGSTEGKIKTQYGELEIEEGESVKLLLQNHLGSVIGQAKTTGVEQVMDYLPYGQAFYESTPAETDRNFTGMDLEGSLATGDPMLDLNARHLVPGAGAFPAADTIDYDVTSMIGRNLYAYAGNDPINFSDPSGHAPVGGPPTNSAVYPFVSGGDNGALGMGGPRGSDPYYQAAYQANMDQGGNSEPKNYVEMSSQNEAPEYGPHLPGQDPNQSVEQNFFEYITYMNLPNETKADLIFQAARAGIVYAPFSEQEVARIQAGIAVLDALTGLPEIQALFSTRPELSVDYVKTAGGGAFALAALLPILRPLRSAKFIQAEKFTDVRKLANGSVVVWGRTKDGRYILAPGHSSKTVEGLRALGTTKQAGSHKQMLDLLRSEGHNISMDDMVAGGTVTIGEGIGWNSRTFNKWLNSAGQWQRNESGVTMGEMFNPGFRTGIADDLGSYMRIR